MIFMVYLWFNSKVFSHIFEIDCQSFLHMENILFKVFKKTKQKKNY